MSLIGLVGGMSYLLSQQQVELPEFLLILAYVLFSMMVLDGLPPVRRWLHGQGHLLGLAIVSLSKAAWGDRVTPAFQVGLYVAGVLLLTHLIVRAVRIERKRKRQAAPAMSKLP